MSGQIEGFIANARMIADEVREAFGDLSPEELNWKPTAESWSVGQCFDHLIITNGLYAANIEKVADGTFRANGFSKIPFLADFVGRMLKKAVSPDSVKKVKTFPIFEPAASDITKTIIGDFIAHQEKMISLMEAVKDRDIRRIKIPTPVSQAVNIRLSDAFEVMLLHERRHFNQARRVLENHQNMER
ncbi:MAG: DinB family protein [Pyrinomonadaceae bacterium]